MSRITFNRPPSRDRAIQALGVWFGRDYRGMTPEQAHKAAAVMAATEHAWRRDLLPQDKWRGFRHVPAKCAEALAEIVNHPTYLAHNNPPIVDVNFK
jgi:hypothetical protein